MFYLDRDVYGIINSLKYRLMLGICNENPFIGNRIASGA